MSQPIQPVTIEEVVDGQTVAVPTFDPPPAESESRFPQPPPPMIRLPPRMKRDGQPKTNPIRPGAKTSKHSEVCKHCGRSGYCQKYGRKGIMQRWRCTACERQHDSIYVTEEYRTGKVEPATAAPAPSSGDAVPQKVSEMIDRILADCVIQAAIESRRLVDQRLMDERAHQPIGSDSTSESASSAAC